MQTSWTKLPALGMIELVPGTILCYSIFLRSRWQCVISLSAGELLQNGSINSFVCIMGHGFGHGIARHRAEFNSWQLVTTCAIFNRLAISSMAIFPATALGCVLSAFVKDVVIGTWLSQQLEYEEDVTGAAIGKAAGYSFEKGFAMSCGEMLCHRIYEFKLPRSGVPAYQQEILASLRALVPNGQLPKAAYDSRNVQMV